MQTQTPTSAKSGQMGGTVTNTDHKAFKLGRTVVTLALIAAALVLIAAISVPNLLRSRTATERAASFTGTPRANEGLAADKLPPMPSGGAGTEFRRVIQTGSMHLMAADPAAALEQITALSREAGGFVESSTLYPGVNEATSATITIRVPAKTFEATRAEIRRLGKLERESAESSDVTAQYVDMEATLRNYRAEEAQYVAIMRGAGSIKDTMDVAQRLSEVRGRIERAQAQLNLMARQAEMASIAITLRAEVGPTGSVSWSPLYELRAAWNDSMQGFADYLNAMLVILFRIPLVLAWAFTVCGLAAVAWRIARWIWRHWFVPPPASQPAL